VSVMRRLITSIRKNTEWGILFCAHVSTPKETALLV
jgi:hypothetical protein